MSTEILSSGEDVDVVEGRRRGVGPERGERD